MRKVSWLGWLLAGVLGALAVAWAAPRALPTLPRPWKVTRAEAAAIGLEGIRDLGDPVPDPYVVVRLDGESLLERRLQIAGGAPAPDLLKRTVDWLVVVYPRGVTSDEWTYQAEVALDGEILALRRRVDPRAPGGAISAAAAREQADAFLRARHVDLAAFGPVEVRSQQLAARTDLAVRYSARRPGPAGTSRGIEVTFAGDRLTGFAPWFEDADKAPVQKVVRGATLAGFGGLVLLFALLFAVAPPFLKRYHEGEVGVRRAVQIFGVVLAGGVVAVGLAARSSAQGSSFGIATREQMTWLVVLFILLFNVLPSAIAAFFAWAVGESMCRERWGHKLAAFDALFQGAWGNATVARSSLAGISSGIALAGGLLMLGVALGRFGAWPLVAFTLPSTVGSVAPSVELVATFLWGFPAVLLGVLLGLFPALARRIGKWPAGLVAAIALTPFLTENGFPIPISASFLLAFLFALGLVALFATRDLLTAVLAALVVHVLVNGVPLFLASDVSLEAHGWAALALATVPLLASLRFLGSEVEFVYRYADIPPHVRRIADRERQRVELETARKIQSSILPDLPPRLGGVDVAHVYLPASEVGGDFYDVLALEDGRVAVAVGDVAGHGVSSGLVMSMARSALAVQVTFDPGVEAVFRTLNRTVFQTARKRLLATLSYALIDPVRREILYASAGHLYPYVVSRDGRVEPLESIAYPLGVRGELPIFPRTAKVRPGDALFVFSDGLVEARGGSSDELYGFDRLERSLARHAVESVERLRDCVLADLRKFTGAQPQEDDLTILVLRVPED